MLGADGLTVVKNVLDRLYNHNFVTKMHLLIVGLEVTYRLVVVAEKKVRKP